MKKAASARTRWLPFSIAQMIYYKYLILEILYLAAGRWGLLEPPKKRTETPASK